MDNQTPNSYTIPNTDLNEALKPQETRMAAHRIMGQATGSGKIGDIITGNPASTNLGTGFSSGIVLVPSAASRSVLFTLTDTFRRVIFVVPDVAVFIGSISAANQWPNASYNMGNFPISIFNDWGQTDNVNVVTRVQMYNNSGADVNIIAVARARILTNSSASLSGTTPGDSSQ